MKNIETYLKEHGGKTFGQIPLCDVDLLIFSQLSYCDFLPAVKGETLCEAVQEVLHAPQSEDATERRFAFQQEDAEQLLLRVAAAKRYREVIFCSFERKCDSENMQFAALHLTLPGGNVIAYRGTDNTLAGWKEDFDLCFKMPVAAQEEALDFFRRAAQENDLPFILTGHSKGGGLLLYAALFADALLRGRVSQAVSFDGVGLPEQVLARIEKDEDYRDILSRIRVILPEASVVGVIFPQPGAVRTIDCRSVGLLQHYPFNWLVEGTDFIESTRTFASRAASIAIEEFLTMLTVQERERVITLLYEIICVTKAETVEDLLRGWFTNAVPMAKAMLEKLDTETVKLYLKVIGSFYRALARTAGILIGGEEETEKGMKQDG